MYDLSCDFFILIMTINESTEVGKSRLIRINNIIIDN